MISFIFKSIYPFPCI